MMKKKINGVILATLIVSASLTGCVTVTVMPKETTAVEVETSTKTDNTESSESTEATEVESEEAVEVTEVESEEAVETESEEAVETTESTEIEVETTAEIVQSLGKMEFKVNGFEFYPGETTKEDFLTKFPVDNATSMMKYSDGGINYTYGKDSELSVDFSSDGTLEAIGVRYSKYVDDTDRAFTFDSLPSVHGVTIDKLERMIGVEGIDDLGLGVYDFEIGNGLVITVNLYDSGEICRITVEKDPFY